MANTATDHAGIPAPISCNALSPPDGPSRDVPHRCARSGAGLAGWSSVLQPLLTLVLVPILHAGAAEPATADALTLRSVSGICQAGPEHMARFADAAGWERHDLSWRDFEPRHGDYQDAYLERFAHQVAAYRAQGQTVLPMIGFGVDWAADAEATYAVDANRRLTTHRLPDGHITMLESRRGADGAWTAGAAQQVSDLDKLPIAADHVADWTEAIRRMASRLMAGDCGLRYFQIWNEAHPDSGFWHGDMATYMQRIHLPAARAIHALGGKVVYGGWPCCGSPEMLVELLDRTDAWSSIDVIDVHYFPVDTMRMLHEAAEKRGHHLGVWQTEIGFTSEPTFIANVYPRFLSFALRSDPGADRYKLFLFAAWSPDDPKAYGFGRTLLSGQTLSPHGSCLRTLGEVLGNGHLALRAGVTCTPPLTDDLNEHRSAMEAFTVDDKRVVIAIHLADRPAAAPAGGAPRVDGPARETPGAADLQLSIPGMVPGTISRIERIGATGLRTDLMAQVVPVDGGMRVGVPRRDAKADDRLGEQGRVDFYVAMTLK
jgi:hypothetical protein